MIYRSVSRTNCNVTAISKPTFINRSMKRVLDVVFSGIALVLLSPLFLVIFICLKVQGKGSAIFSQERIGKNGKPFTIYKFRTMRVDAEVAGPQLAIKNDERLTPIGKFLRHRHLDELPQFWNIFKGDMSVVGYRPERKFFIDKIMREDSRYELLFTTRPGLTSEATLYNGYTNTLDDMLRRLEMDLQYLQYASLLKDIQIIAKTAEAIVLGRQTK